MRRMATLLLLLVEDNRHAFLTFGCPRGDNLVDLLALGDSSPDSRPAPPRQALRSEGVAE